MPDADWAVSSASPNLIPVLFIRTGFDIV